jgi:hypothetical protein
VDDNGMKSRGRSPNFERITSARGPVPYPKIISSFALAQFWGNKSGLVSFSVFSSLKLLCATPAIQVT